LEQTDLELNNVQINIPLTTGSNPIVSECDGEYSHEARKNILVWYLPIIDASTKSGSMEFSVPNSRPLDFFPLHISFTSKTAYAKIKVSFNKLCILILHIDSIYLILLQVNEVTLVEDDSPVKYSVETIFFTDNYEVV
jgi:hypothetical protein